MGQAGFLASVLRQSVSLSAYILHCCHVCIPNTNNNPPLNTGPNHESLSLNLLHTIVIPAREILEIEVRPSVFSGRKGFTWGIKLDNSDLHRHVRVRRKTGFWKRIAFTPDNPDEFVRVCKTIA